MVYSYTQISQYVTCPRRYRHRYLDGWREKDTRAAMFFGRAFEQALGAYLRREDPGDVLFREWSACKDQNLQFSNHDTWDRMLEQGIMLLTRFCQDDRVRICQPRRNLQVKFTRPIGRNEFVAYVDGMGKLDGRRCLLEWKTSAGRYPEEPKGLLALDPQLICYSWITGISKVAQVVFVRKRLVESSTCGPRSPTRSVRSLVISPRIRSSESNRQTSRRTAVFAFRRIRAAPARTWVSAWESKS
jgi:PD-(D/E)XK nuclease superfamily